MTEEVQILGLREMREALIRKIPYAMQGKVLQKAMVDGCRPLVERAKQLAPGVGQSQDKTEPSRATGILKASIHSEKDRTASNGVFEARIVRPRGSRGGKKENTRIRRAKMGLRDPKLGKIKRTRGSGASYWRHVEFGRKGMAAQPYLRPAFDATKTQMVQETVLGLQRAMVDAVRGAKWATPKR